MVVLLREVLAILFKIYAYIFPLSMIVLDGGICDQSLIRWVNMLHMCKMYLIFYHTCNKILYEWFYELYSEHDF